jgi:hypothetical protein
MIKSVRRLLYGYAIKTFRSFAWTQRRLPLLLDASRSLPNSPVYGAIDGSGLRVARAGGVDGPFNEGQELDYNGYGQAHKIRVVGVFLLDGMGGTILGPYHGNTNDAGIMITEQYYDRLRDFHTHAMNQLHLPERPLLVGTS